MLHYVRATLLNPIGPADWVNISLADHHYEDYKALTAVGGKPAIIYLTQPLAGIYQVRYAYAHTAEPEDATDWTSTAATDQSAAGERFLPGQLRIDDPYPRFTFWSSLTDQLCYAAATADPPAAPADWEFTPLTEPGGSGSYSTLAWWKDRPLALHAGAGSNQLHCSASSVEQPLTLLDWDNQPADSESQGLRRLSAIRLPDALGVTYRDADPPGALMYAWFENALPGGPGDWCVMQVTDEAGPGGANALALTHDGRAAIVYGDTDDNQLWLATMDPLE